MPEILRSLIVVLLLATFVFYFSRRYADVLGLKVEVLKSRINAWYAITCAAFLAHNFWIFCAITALVLLYAAKSEKNPLALVFFVLYAVPLFGLDIPGGGLVNYIFNLTYYRVLALVVLLPLFLHLRKKKESIPFGRTWADKFVIGYVIYSLCLVVPSTTITNTVRLAFVQVIDILLPYYVASRHLQTLEDFKDTLQSLLVASCIAALIAILEYLKGWLLYSAVSSALGVDWDYGGYLKRGEDLRALASSGQAIVLGYTMAVALGLYTYIAGGIQNKQFKWAIGLLLLLGLFVPVSRGPWIGAAVIYLVTILMGPTPLQKLMKLGVALVIPATIFLATPYGAKFTDYLPFVGTVDAETVSYRQDLFKNSVQVISENLLFGSADFLNTDEMESLRAGGNGGIIDLVNSYIAIALSGGLVGLSLFVGIFVVCAMQTFFALRRLKGDPEMQLLGQALLSTLLGVMIIIYTVSSILIIPILYWMLGGMCVAYVSMVSKITASGGVQFDQGDFRRHQ